LKEILESQDERAFFQEGEQLRELSQFNYSVQPWESKELKESVVAVS